MKTLWLIGLTVVLLGLATAIFFARQAARRQVERVIDDPWHVQEIEQLSDPAKLAAVATNADELSVRRVVAISKLADPALLARLAADTDADIRYAAVMRLTDPSALAKALTDVDADVRLAAAGRVVDLSPLSALAADDASPDVRRVAALRIRLGQSPRPDDPTAAIGATDESAALDAVDHLAGQDSLRRVFLESRHTAVRARALERLNAESLASLEAAASSPADRLAVQIQLGKTTWITAVTAAEVDTAKLEQTGRAMLLRPRPARLSGPADELCQSMIRLGDARLLGLLTELLDAFGSKRLAADFINCGQPDLEAAGRQWASSHGFTLVSGGGSRVGWGQGR